jgi:predicted AlkP superfamily phosphohydrolase/phosphomutase
MSGPLVILAMDTGDAEAIKRWVATGHLPTIGKVMDRGCWGVTSGPETICEYGFGLTLFSGISRGSHGYYYFRQLTPGTYDFERMRPPTREAPPFWTTLSRTDRKALVVDVPDLRPVAGVDGLQLSNWATHHGSIYEPESEPPELVEDVRRLFGPRMKIHSDPEGTMEDSLVGLERLLERARKKGELARDLIKRDAFDVIVIFFSETDAASHFLWEYRSEVPASRDTAIERRLENGLRDVYAAVDRQMGTLLDQLPASSNVVIMSLYGFQDEYPTSNLIESFLDELGYRVPKGTGKGVRTRRISVPDPVQTARRLMPERLREAISRRLSPDAQERLLSSRLRDGTDWDRTLAFAIPSLYTSFVRVNLRGREPHGCVEPGNEYEAVLGRIEEDLEQLVDPATGVRAVRSASRATDLFGGGPPVTLPDLFVEWEPQPHFVSAVIHPRARLTQSRPSYCPSSQEKLNGFIAAHGPAIGGRGDLGEVDLLDLAPTFLTLMGLPPPETMGGCPINALLQTL